MRVAVLLAAGCLAATGCQQLAVPPAGAAEPTAIWMSRTFSWGVQCPDRAGTAPDSATAKPPRPAATPSADAGAAAPKPPDARDCLRQDVLVPAAQECLATALAAGGIAIREKRAESLSVCEACGCPASSARFWFLVALSARKAMEEAGYAVGQPPPRDQ